MKLPYVVALCISFLISACGMHSGGMMPGGMSAPTPNLASTPVASIKNILLIEPWARPGTKGDNSASYVAINNEGGADTLVAVSGDIAASIELHTVIKSNGLMQMVPVEGGIPIAANAVQVLKPGSFHIMMIGLTKDLAAGDSFTLKMTFAKAGDVTITVPVR